MHAVSLGHDIQEAWGERRHRVDRGRRRSLGDAGGATDQTGTPQNTPSPPTKSFPTKSP